MPWAAGAPLPGARSLTRIMPASVSLDMAAAVGLSSSSPSSLGSGPAAPGPPASISDSRVPASISGPACAPARVAPAPPAALLPLPPAPRRSAPSQPSFRSHRPSASFRVHSTGFP